MSRMYVVQSWSNAAAYSGEQIGNRLAKSENLFLPNGQANIELFSDVGEKPKVIKKKKASEQIDLAERHFNRLEKLSADLDEEYFSGELSEERYQFLRYKMDIRLLKAWERVQKECGPFWQKEDEQWEIEKANDKSPNSWTKSIEKSLIDGDGWVSLALKDCSENNVFLQGFLLAVKAFKLIRGVLK